MIEPTEEQVRDAMRRLGRQSMPTVSQLASIGEGALSCRLCRKGMDYWADKWGIPRAQHCSRMGWEWEDWVADRLDGFGWSVVRRTRKKAPHDLCVNGNRVEVKSANPSLCNGYTVWGFRCTNQVRPDYFVLVRLEPGMPPVPYIVPEAMVPRTNVTMGRNGKYERWRHRWDQLEKS